MSELEPPAPPAADAPKPVWRRWAEARRAALSPPARAAADRARVAALRAWPPFTEARDVLVYLAFGDEAALDALFATPGVRFHAPRSHPGGRLTLHPLEPDALEPHPYGYLQPPADALETPPERIDLALVPGLAFDETGTRLGYGMGFYDRLLPRLRPGVPRVGVCAGGPCPARLPREPHDAPVTHLLTEEGVVAIDGGTSAP